MAMNLAPAIHEIVVDGLTYLNDLPDWDFDELSEPYRVFRQVSSHLRIDIESPEFQCWQDVFDALVDEARLYGVRVSRTRSGTYRFR